jgi:hypothetical protein
MWPLAAVAMAACFPTTTRPAFVPLPNAPVTEVKLDVREATQAIALLLDQDSIPIRRTMVKDGWLESEWLDATTMRPTTRRHLGPDVVKIRIWVDPSRPNYSNITAETVYLPTADPSRSPRELERQVPATNKAAGRVLVAVGVLARQYGDPVDTTAARADTTAPRLRKGIHDTTTAGRDTTATRPDSAVPRGRKGSRDTTAVRFLNR